MQKLLINTFMLVLTVLLWGCGGDSSNDTTPPSPVSITLSQELIDATEDGGTFTITVNTTGSEWGAYADKDFINLSTANTLGQSLYPQIHTRRLVLVQLL